MITNVAPKNYSYLKTDFSTSLKKNPFSNSQSNTCVHHHVLLTEGSVYRKHSPRPFDYCWMEIFCRYFQLSLFPYMWGSLSGWLVRVIRFSQVLYILFTYFFFFFFLLIESLFSISSIICDFFLSFLLNLFWEFCCWMNIFYNCHMYIIYWFFHHYEVFFKIRKNIPTMQMRKLESMKY